MSQESAMQPLSPRMLYAALADALRERIFRHELRPGEPLDEFRLASGYGVSRTPVREALKVLVTEGLVELRARRGCFVARLKWSDVVQLFDTLELLERFAAREAARAGIVPAAGPAFHRSLAEASGNIYLPDLVERLAAKLRLAFGPAFDDPEVQPSAATRVGLEQAIAAGDAAEASRLLALCAERRRQAGQDAFARAERALPLADGAGRPPAPGEGGETFCAAAV